MRLCQTVERKHLLTEPQRAQTHSPGSVWEGSPALTGTNLQHRASRTAAKGQERPFPACRPPAKEGLGYWYPVPNPNSSQGTQLARALWRKPLLTETGRMGRKGISIWGMKMSIVQRRLKLSEAQTDLGRRGNGVFIRNSPYHGF